MLTNALLTTALLATAASANFMAHQEMKREMLQPRQTATEGGVGGISTECQTALLDIYSSLPSPPAEILSDAVQNPQTDPCSFSTPASLSKQYASYSSEVVSWYSENQKEIGSVLSECPVLSQYATMVPVCETGAGSPKATDASDATMTDAMSSAMETGAAASVSKAVSSAMSKAASSAASAASGSAAGTSPAAATQTGNSGHRETGMAIVAMAVAGLVVAAL